MSSRDVFIPFNADISSTLSLVEQARREYILIRIFTSRFPDTLNRACATVFGGQLFIPPHSLSLESDDEHERALLEKRIGAQNVIKEAGVTENLEVGSIETHTCVCRIVELRPSTDLTSDNAYCRVITIEVDPSDLNSTVQSRSGRQFDIAMGRNAMEALYVGQYIEGDVHILSSGLW